MIPQQLIDYVNQQIKAGESKENIKTQLISVGWKQEDIDKALGSIQEEKVVQGGMDTNAVNPVPSQVEEKPQLPKIEPLQNTTNSSIQSEAVPVQPITGMPQIVDNAPVGIKDTPVQLGQKPNPLPAVPEVKIEEPKEPIKVEEEIKPKTVVLDETKSEEKGGKSKKVIYCLVIVNVVLLILVIAAAAYYFLTAK